MNPDHAWAVCCARRRDRANTDNVAIAGQKEMDGSMARSRFTFLSSLILVLLVAIGGTLRARGQEVKVGPAVTAKPGEWRYLNSDPMSTRYSPLDQIDKDNFKDLKVAWQKWVFHTVPKAGEFGADTWENESNEYTGNTGVWAPII